MKFGSVCSGIEAASVAWHPLGWKPAFFSEIEAFPSAVLAHHYPDVPNLGDMTQFKEWIRAAIDVLVGGTPCQSFSVSGLRGGLADPRGNLLLTYLAIAAEYRPRWLVWENVPGVLSTNGGRDFGSLLGALGQLGYGWAYRILDAQHCRAPEIPYAVPQSRRRLFVVAHRTSWQCAAAALFDGASLRGDPAPSRWTWRGPASEDVDDIEAYNSSGIGKYVDARGVGATLLRTGGEIGAGGDNTLIVDDDRLRRMTPPECEALMGFPQGYTEILYRGRYASDGPRYEALGNSMPVNVMRVIGERIAMVEEMTA